MKLAFGEFRFLNTKDTPLVITPETVKPALWTRCAFQRKALERFREVKQRLPKKRNNVEWTAGSTTYVTAYVYQREPA